MSPAERTIRAVQLGRTEYRAALALQREYHARRRAGVVGDTLLLTEHEPVITTGQGADFRHLLVDQREVERLGIPLVRTERGGDITYHGPGQLVAYPILDLRGFGRDVHAYVRRLEDTAIALLGAYGVAGDRRPGAPGVYAGAGKIASIGVFVSRWVTMHGIAINVCPAPEQLALIEPCGLAGTRFTSVGLLTRRRPGYAEVCSVYMAAFATAFDCRLLVDDRPAPADSAPCAHSTGHIRW